jgi:hypothetical protein
MGATEDKAELERVRQRLREHLSKVPSGHSSWSVQRAVDFKHAHLAAQKALNKAAPKPGELLSHINAITRYFA